MTPHSVDGIAGAFGSSVVELSFLHPEQKSPTAIRQINSNLTSFILCSFHKLGFPIYVDLLLRFILRKAKFYLLSGDYVGRTWAFFTLSNLELDLLPFIKSGVAVHFNIRVVDKQVIAAIIRDNKTVSLT